jgi:hypothetical protein
VVVRPIFGLVRFVAVSGFVSAFRKAILSGSRLGIFLGCPGDSIGGFERSGGDSAGYPVRWGDVVSVGEPQFGKTDFAGCIVTLVAQ